MFILVYLVFFFYYNLLLFIKGTFLYNCIQDRQKNSLHKRTYSLWNYILDNIHLFKNSNYTPIQQPIYVKLGKNDIMLWEEYYYRWNYFDTIGNEYFPK